MELMEINLGELWEIVEDRGAWGTAVNGVAKSHTWLRDQTTTKLLEFLNYEGYMCYLKIIYNYDIILSDFYETNYTYIFFLLTVMD